MSNAVNSPKGYGVASCGCTIISDMQEVGSWDPRQDEVNRTCVLASLLAKCK